MYLKFKRYNYVLCLNDRLNFEINYIVKEKNWNFFVYKKEIKSNVFNIKLEKYVVKLML